MCVRAYFVTRDVCARCLPLDLVSASVHQKITARDTKSRSAVPPDSFVFAEKKIEKLHLHNPFSVKFQEKKNIPFEVLKKEKVLNSAAFYCVLLCRVK